MRSLLKSSRALSPVIGAIILIAIVITVTLVAGSWMAGLTFSFMKTEQIQIVNENWSPDNSYVDLTVLNSGTDTVKISSVFVNSEPAQGTTFVSGSSSLEGGESAILRVFHNYESDAEEFRLVTQSGNQFTIVSAMTSSGIPAGLETLRPNGEGFYQQWNIFGGSTSFVLSSDLSDSTGVQVTGSTTLLEINSLSDSTINAGEISSVTAYARAKVTSTETQPTGAFISYRDSTNSLDTPKTRTSEDGSWNSQGELSSSGSPIRLVRSITCPILDRLTEKIVVTLSDDGYLDAYVWDGNAWTVTNDVGNPGTGVNSNRCFDVVYEKTSGRALLVYSTGSTSNEIGFRIWTAGSGWGSEQLLDLPYTSGKVRWVSLAASSGARSGAADDNEVSLMYVDSKKDVFGYIWTGSDWSDMGATSVWDNSAATYSEECIAVAYEQTTGESMFIWADSVSTDFYYRIWDGSTLSANTLLNIGTAGGIGNWVTLKADPGSDDLFLLSVDGGSDLNTAYWNGSSWLVHLEHDNKVDTNARRCADFAWEPIGGKGLLVYGTTNGEITYETFEAPNVWTGPTNVAMGTKAHHWVQLQTNPRVVPGDVMILGAVLEANTLNLGAISWDGTTFSIQGASTFSSDVGKVNYESFSLAFEQHVPVEKAVLLLRTHDSNFEGAEFTLDRVSFTEHSEIMLTNPITGVAWTWDEVNALELGCRASSLWSDETAQISEFWVVVDYSGTDG